MTDVDRDIGTILADPSWLPHRFDPDRDTVHFVRADRATIRAVTFLTDEYLPAAGSPLVLERPRAIANAPGPAPLHFIFHAAYCCSTLLARALDWDGAATALREPVILNDLVGWGHRGGDPRRVAAVLNDVLTLLARPSQRGEAVIVKPSNVTNALAPAILGMRPASRAILLYAPLRAYLGSIARKGMAGRLWVRELQVKFLKDGLLDFPFSTEDHLGHTDLQVAGLGWLAQQVLFARLFAAHGPGRVRMLDSEILLAAPGAALAAATALFALPLDEATIDAIASGPVFTRHSKSAEPFGRAHRLAEQRNPGPYDDEIEKVALWIDAVATSVGHTVPAGAHLLAQGSASDRGGR